MKRLFAATLLIALLGVMVFFNFTVTDASTREMTALVTECRDLYQNDKKQDAADLAARAEEYWARAEGRILLFLNRGAVDEISESLARLASYAKSGNDTLFDAESRLCLMMLDHLHESEQILVF